MLKRKQTKGSGSQAPIPEEKSKREAPVERLWERSREGRKETNRELSMQNRKEADGKPAVDEGERRRGRKEPSLDKEPTVRRRSRGQKGRSRRLSSRKGSKKRTKGSGGGTENTGSESGR